VKSFAFYIAAGFVLAELSLKVTIITKVTWAIKLVLSVGVKSILVKGCIMAAV